MMKKVFLILNNHKQSFLCIINLNNGKLMDKINIPRSISSNLAPLIDEEYTLYKL